MTPLLLMLPALKFTAVFILVMFSLFMTFPIPKDEKLARAAVCIFAAVAASISFLLVAAFI